MKSKGWKTDLVSFIGLLLGIVIVGFWLMDKIDNEKLTLGVATLGVLIGIATAKLSKDQTGTHTK